MTCRMETPKQRRWSSLQSGSARGAGRRAILGRSRRDGARTTEQSPNPNIGWPTTRLHLGTWRFARQSPPVVWRRSCDANDMFQMKKMSGCWVALAFTQRKIDVW